MQALASQTALLSIHVGAAPDAGGGGVSAAFQALLSSLARSEARAAAVWKKRFHDALLPPHERGLQMDAHEFLQRVALLPSEADSWLTPYLRFETYEVMRCTVCQSSWRAGEAEHVQVNQELKLDLPNGDGGPDTMQRLLDDYFSEPPRHDNELARCQTCGIDRPYRKQVTCHSTPRLLVVHIAAFRAERDPRNPGRFVEEHREHRVWTRRSERVSLPLHHGPQPFALTALVFHRQYPNGSGHYYAYVRRGSQWWRCDDSNVTAADLDRCDREQSASDAIYLAFYESED